MKNNDVKKSNSANFQVGDLVKVTTKDLKQNKVNPAPFTGMVISMRGEGTNKTFTVRKIGANQIAVERIFPLNSPHIENIKTIKREKVRRAKLTYLRKKRTLL